MKFTVKQLIENLEAYDEDLEVQFGAGHIQLYRLREVGEKVNFEFNQSIYRDDNNKLVIEAHD